MLHERGALTIGRSSTDHTREIAPLSQLVGFRDNSAGRQVYLSLCVESTYAKPD